MRRQQEPAHRAQERTVNIMPFIWQILTWLKIVGNVFSSRELAMRSMSFT
jgi:hypothetical protein